MNWKPGPSKTSIQAPIEDKNGRNLELKKRITDKMDTAPKISDTDLIMLGIGCQKDIANAEIHCLLEQPPGYLSRRHVGLRDQISYWLEFSC